MTDHQNEDEVSGLDMDRQAQNPDQTTTADVTADDVDADDPHKAETLVKAGRDDAPGDAEE